MRLAYLLMIQVGCSGVATSPVQPSQPVRVVAAERTIYDPRVCEHANVPRLEARWRRFELREGLWSSRMAYANGELFVFGYGDHDPTPHGTRIDLATARRTAFDVKALANPPRNELPPAWCIDGELVFWGAAWGRIFDPVRGAWRSVATTGAPASTTSTTDGRVLFVVEADLDRELTGAIYDPKADRWTAIAAGPALGLGHVSLQYVGGKLLVYGCNTQLRCAVVPYDPARDAWEREIDVPNEIAGDVRILDRRTVAHAGALWLFAWRHRSSHAETLRLDGRSWVRGPDVAGLHPQDVALTVLGGREEGFAYSRTWNAPSAPRFRQSGTRLTARMHPEPLARISDALVLPRPDYPFLDEGDRLAVGGNLLTLTMVRSNTAAPPDRALWMLGPAQAPAPVVERPPPPVAARGAVDPTVADVTIEGHCPDAYGTYAPYAAPPQYPASRPSHRLIFLEDARRPIATVLLGHYKYSDIPECHLDQPPVTIAAIAMGKTELATQVEKRTATALAGTFSRPLAANECIQVIKCDDLDGNQACEPDEPSLVRVNDRSRYEQATVSRRAQWKLTVASRNDSFCAGYNWYSRCCPDGWMLDKERDRCEYIWDHRQVQATRCP